MPSSHLIVNDNEHFSFSDYGSRPYYSGSNIAVPLLSYLKDLDGNRYINMWASQDGGATWAIADEDNAPACGRLAPADSHPGASIQVGSKVYVVYFEYATRQMEIKEFDVGSLTWGSVIATGGPSIHSSAGVATTSDAASLSITCDGSGSTFTITYRTTDNPTGVNSRPKTRAVRVSGGSFGTPVDTFDEGTPEHSYSNLSSIDDGSGNTHMFARWQRGIISLPNLRTLHQVWKSDGTLGPVNEMETDPGTLFENVRLSNWQGLQPRIIGGNIQFWTVYQSWNEAQEEDEPPETPQLGYYSFSAVESPGTFPMEPIVETVNSAADSTFENVRLEPNIGIALADTPVIGVVTREDDTIAGNTPFFYHDISDLITGSQRLVVWAHKAEDLGGFSEDYPILYGAYWDDTGLTGAPFVIYEGDLEDNREIQQINVSVPPARRRVVRNFSYFGYSMGTFSTEGGYSLLA